MFGCLAWDLSRLPAGRPGSSEWNLLKHALAVGQALGIKDALKQLAVIEGSQITDAEPLAGQPMR
jgi:hypothetical protein